SRLEERRGDAGLERRSLPDGDRHQLAVGREIEELLAVGAPSRLRTAARGHLPVAAGTGERRDIDLPLARLVGGVGDPAPVGRELPVADAERGLQVGSRLALADAEVPELEIRARVDRAEQDEAPV